MPRKALPSLTIRAKRTLLGDTVWFPSPLLNATSLPKVIQKIQILGFFKIPPPRIRKVCDFTCFVFFLSLEHSSWKDFSRCSYPGDSQWPSSSSLWRSPLQPLKGSRFHFPKEGHKNAELPGFHEWNHWVLHILNSKYLRISWRSRNKRQVLCVCVCFLKIWIYYDPQHSHKEIQPKRFRTTKAGNAVF